MHCRSSAHADTSHHLQDRGLLAWNIAPSNTPSGLGHLMRAVTKIARASPRYNQYSFRAQPAHHVDVAEAGVVERALHARHDRVGRRLCQLALAHLAAQVGLDAPQARLLTAFRDVSNIQRMAPMQCDFPARLHMQQGVIMQQQAHCHDIIRQQQAQCHEEDVASLAYTTRIRVPRHMQWPQQEQLPLSGSCACLPAW